MTDETSKDQRIAEAEARRIAASILRRVLAKRGEGAYLIDALTRSALRREAEELDRRPCAGDPGFCTRHECPGGCMGREVEAKP